MEYHLRSCVSLRSYTYALNLKIPKVKNHVENTDDTEPLFFDRGLYPPGVPDTATYSLHNSLLKKGMTTHAHVRSLEIENCWNSSARNGFRYRTTPHSNHGSASFTTLIR